MAMNYTNMADEIATAMGYVTTSDQIKAFAQGIIEGIQAGVPTFGGVPTPHKITLIIPASMATLVQGYAGYPSVSTELLGICTGVSNHVMLAGIITYTGPGPLPPTYNEGGTIAGLTGSVCAALVQTAAGFPSVSTELLAMCTAICDHIVANCEIELGIIT